MEEARIAEWSSRSGTGGRASLPSRSVETSNWSAATVATRGTDHMRIFSVASLVAGAVGLTALPVAAAAQQEQGRDVTIWNWDGKVDAGHWFNLSNVNGSVTVDKSSDNSVHVRAEKFPRRDGDIRDVRFVVIQRDGDVRVCALSKENDRCDEDGLHSYGDDDRDRRGDRNVEVKFTVHVPRGVRVGAGTVNGSMSVTGTGAEVRATTVNGGVDVSDAGGQVKATTVNGNVRVTTSAGPVSASTVNGSISARMGNLSRDGDMRFNTVNGTITVETPPSLDANISIDTMFGGISSD